ncbi:MAG: hypothetical protein Fur0017_06380 [Anaerolineales bacterium]
MKTNPALLLLLTFSFIISACNLGVPAPQNNSESATAAALTVEAVLTRPAASPTAGQTENMNTATPTAQANCEQRATIVTWMRDNITYDAAEVNKRLAPGKGFIMSWALQNSGTCIWDDTYKMTFESGERLTQQDSIPVMPKGYTVKPGEILTINIQMTAPSAPGEYETSFSLTNAEGVDVLNVGVLTNVGSTSAAGNLAAPGDLRYAYDCTSGIVRISLTWQDRANGEDGYRIYRDGAKLSDLPAGSTVYDDIAPAPGSYLYTVAAFNASGESTAKVTAETSNCK